MSIEQIPHQIARPTKPGSYVLVARSEKIAKNWQELANQVPAECQRVYDQLSANPTYADGDRQHPLKGVAGQGIYQSQSYVRWQIDVTSSGRVWYFVDAKPFGEGRKRRTGTVIVDQVHPGHPKSTEVKPAMKRRPGRR